MESENPAQGNPQRESAGGAFGIRHRAQERHRVAALAVRATVGLAALKVATMAARASAVMVMVDRPDYASAPAVFQNRSLSATHSNFSSTTYKNMSDTMRGRGKRVVECRTEPPRRRGARRVGRASAPTTRRGGRLIPRNGTRGTRRGGRPTQTRRARVLAWREANSEKWRAQQQAYREKNREPRRAYDKARRAANREKVRVAALEP